jgi:hypothetical protein
MHATGIVCRFAAHAALVDVFPSKSSLFDALLASLGYSAPGTAGAVGLTACQAVLDSRGCEDVLRAGRCAARRQHRSLGLQAVLRFRASLDRHPLFVWRQTDSRLCRSGARYL